MGGCRCTFRECENGTSTRKDLHYFRYPVRDAERLKIWLRNAARYEFSGMSMDKLANKVVCQLHFEQEMFMNELCERLTKMAVPRLMPQRDGSFHNVETGVLSAGDDKLEDQVVEEPTTPPPVQNKTTEKMKRGDAKKTSPDEPSFKKIKILNSQSLMVVNRPSGDVPCEVIRIKSPAIAAGLASPMRRRKQPLRRLTSPESQWHQTQKQFQEMPTKAIEINQSDDENVPVEKLLESHEIDEDGYFLDEEEQSAEVTTVSNEAILPMDSRLTLSPVPAPITVPVIDPTVSEKLEQNGREIERLQKLVQQLIDRPPPAPPTVVSAAVPTKVVMEKGPQLTKAQLFNSIKRYLNPTMVSLLRMELFAGAPDRQWKSDEKSFAAELISMGEQVYDCFQNEFCFRLPPKSDAKQWKESGEMDADDAC